MEKKTTLFNYRQDDQQSGARPLASRMRPETLDEILGQDHILSSGKALRRMIETGKFSNMILHGPPGSGKTSLAYVISKVSDHIFETLNATTAGIKEIRAVAEKAGAHLSMYGQKTILFIDEIHRFNATQQDALLPHTEDGTFALIGATTENPYFELSAPLLSRSAVFVLKELEPSHIHLLLDRALTDKERGYGKYDIHIDREAKEYISAVSSGDARNALNILEMTVLSMQLSEEGPSLIDKAQVEKCMQQRSILYDATGDNHYDTISAFIKSMRGSDVDAAVFYLAKMLAAGEDIQFIGRRMLIFASEDIGNADPQALSVALSAFQAATVVGLPEARIILAQAATYLAGAPKSNASYVAISSAMEDIRSGIDLNVPEHLKNKPILAKEVEYKYPHDYEGAYVQQDYLPKGVKNKRYYVPTDRGYEREISQYLRSLKKNKNT